MRLALDTIIERCSILATLERQLQSPVIKVAELDILSDFYFLIQAKRRPHHFLNLFGSIVLLFEWF